MSTRVPDDIDARVAQVRRNVLAAVPHTRTHRFSGTGRAAIALGASAVVAIGLTGGTIAVVQASQHDIDTQARCYVGASLSADFIEVSQAAGIDNESGEVVEEYTGLIELCGEMWRMGLGQENPPADPNTGDFPKPELVGCTMPDGIGAAFPRGESTASDAEFCGALGLAVWAA